MSVSKSSQFITPLHLANASEYIFSSKALVAQISQFSGADVLIIGDIMLDQYLGGSVERISPEAPVPIVRVENESVCVGGAGNVARNITSLGGKATLIGVTGHGPHAEQVAEILTSENVNSCLIKVKDRKTTIKTRIMAKQQQMLRIDKEDTDPLSDNAIDEILKNVEEKLNNASSIIISDYGKGIVCSRFIEGFGKMVEGRNLPVLIDPKPQNCDLYAGATLLTPNAKETKELSALPVSSKEEIITAGRYLMKTLNCPCMITTLSEEGMAVFLEDGSVWHIGTLTRHVFDVTGAGDTVIGVAALGLAAGLPLVDACVAASFAAGLVVGEVGAAVVTQSELTSVMLEQGNINLERWA